MAYPRQLRDQLGISARVFADIIQCTYGQLSMTEAGKRPLPLASLTVCTVIEQWLAVNPVSDLDNETWSPQLDKYLRSRRVLLANLAQRATLVKEKLVKMQTQQAFSNAFGKPATEQVDEIVTLQLAILHRQSLKNLQQLSREHFRLQIILSGLKAELAEAEHLQQLTLNL